MNDSRRCKAMLSDGSRRCKNAAIHGGAVCAKHGGSAPQVKRSARERLARLVDPAIDALAAALESGDHRATLRACRLVLDRAGYPPTSEVQLRDINHEWGRQVVDIIDDVLRQFGLPVETERVRRVVVRRLREMAGEDPGEEVDLTSLSEGTKRRILYELETGEPAPDQNVKVTLPSNGRERNGSGAQGVSEEPEEVVL